MKKRVHIHMNPIRRRSRAIKMRQRLKRGSVVACEEVYFGDGTELDLDDPDVGYRLRMIHSRP